MEYLVERAYAKINIYLDIIDKMDDGYHNLLTIMQLVSLYDTVSLDLNMTKEISLTCEGLDVEPTKNLAYIAAQKFYENLSFEAIGRVDIKITKRIPIAAGLAGGSADAGAVLRGLNWLYGKPYTTKELCEIGLSIGSDVPFCIVGGTHTCRGKGEIGMRTFGIRHYNLLIAKGENKLSTAEQFKKLDKKFNNFKDYKYAEGYAKTLDLFIAGRCSEAFKATKNIFESLYDENSSVAKIKDVMYKNGAYFAMLTGSGPSVVGIFPDGLYAEDAKQALEAINIESYMCMPINTPYEEIDPRIDPWR